MKISYNWLQTYFKEQLPKPEAIADAFTFHAFEVEGVEKVYTDTVFDIKVLPDRAHYALCHKGIALELSAILKLDLKVIEKKNAQVNSTKEVKMEVPDFKLVSRYCARYIEGIVIKESPAWLKERLESVGQRSINNIVDITNYILLDTGQPLHAFDADKINGTLSFRFGKKGEKLTVFDDRELELDETILVEVDDINILTLAGIKGGKNEGISNSTKNIILDAGNFEATTVRKASLKLGVRSDGSKRHENNLLPYFSMDSLEAASVLIAELFPEAKMGPIHDIYPHPIKPITFTVSHKAINSQLGIEIPEKDMLDILSRIEVKVEKNGDSLELHIPAYRNDIKDLNDIAEEVGRIYGYDKIKPTLPENTGFKPELEKTFYYSEKIKNILAGIGFSEVYTYSLVSEGEFEIEKSLASDKNFLRKDLTGGISKSLDFNVKNADLLGLDEIKIFEIGKIFTKDGEQTALAIGIKNTKKKQEKENIKLIKIKEVLSKELEIEIKSADGANVIEINLDTLIADLSEPKTYDDLKLGKAVSLEYKKFSQFPFITRDIALFVDSSIEMTMVQDVIQKCVTTSGVLIKGPDLFDQFEKEGKKSFGFRMIFQAQDRTLTDEEVNGFMEKLYAVVKEKGWQVR